MCCFQGPDHHNHEDLSSYGFGVIFPIGELRVTVKRSRDQTSVSNFPLWPNSKDSSDDLFSSTLIQLRVNLVLVTDDQSSMSEVIKKIQHDKERMKNVIFVTFVEYGLGPKSEIFDFKQLIDRQMKRDVAIPKESWVVPIRTQQDHKLLGPYMFVVGVSPFPSSLNDLPTPRSPPSACILSSPFNRSKMVPRTGAFSRGMSLTKDSFTFKNLLPLLQSGYFYGFVNSEAAEKILNEKDFDHYLLRFASETGISLSARHTDSSGEKLVCHWSFKYSIKEDKLHLRVNGTDMPLERFLRYYELHHLAHSDIDGPGVKLIRACDRLGDQPAEYSGKWRPPKGVKSPTSPSASAINHRHSTAPETPPVQSKSKASPVQSKREASPQIMEFLKREDVQLERYHDEIVKKGVRQLKDLHELTESDLSEMMTSIERNRFSEGLSAPFPKDDDVTIELHDKHQIIGISTALKACREYDTKGKRLSEELDGIEAVSLPAIREIYEKARVHIQQQFPSGQYPQLTGAGMTEDEAIALCMYTLCTPVDLSGVPGMVSSYRPFLTITAKEVFAVLIENHSEFMTN
ncbi:hypothetical protein PROFUN_13521 [Planoprotostelium fungivorum]|uniref:SH2 domain-containing protein n=1 Tax=Planoprotostelium fungivorum TaxID=1890364 RepID=A0A2P6N3J6_9EUKA|nr:hypothetical protein PROFUN_13521 [Planoprotostelium fungivorum]